MTDVFSQDTSNSIYPLEINGTHQYWVNKNSPRVSKR